MELIKLWHVSMLWVVWEKLSGLFITVFALIYRLNIIAQSWQLICFCYISGVLRKPTHIALILYSKFHSVSEKCYITASRWHHRSLLQCAVLEKTIPDVKKGSDVFLLLKEHLFQISVCAASHPEQQSRTLMHHCVLGWTPTSIGLCGN